MVRDRLRALGVPYTNVDIELDAGAARLVESLNGGHRVTPTVLFGGEASAMAEPPMDQLDARLAEDGWPIRRPEPSTFQGDLLGRPVPLLTLVDAEGGAFALNQFRGRRQLAVFFAHSADCRACAGYARQLAAVRDQLADADSRAFAIVPGGPAEAAYWRAEATDRIPILADRNGRWKESIAAYLQLDADGRGAMLVALDRFLAPRAASIADDAGGLITPGQAVEWLEFAALECAECAPAVTWEG